MPHRITRPWLLFDWVYGMTETASAEIDQKNKLDNFTRKVNQKKKAEEEMFNWRELCDSFSFVSLRADD